MSAIEFSKEEREKFVSGIRGSRPKTIKNGEVVNTVLAQYKPLLESSNITAYIMKCFVEAMRMYNSQTKSFSFDILGPIYSQAMQTQGEGVDKTLSLLDQVYEYDYELHNSNAQAKRNARGYFLECILGSLFEHYAKNEFLSQVKIKHSLREKRIDFVVGTSSIYDSSQNLLYVTAKKSLRERGAQINQEKKFLGDKLLFFFYADDLKRISDGNMEGFYNDDIVLVTFQHTIPSHYLKNKNVISYEKFFLEILPAYFKDKENFRALDFGIETAHQRLERPGMIIRRTNA